MNCHLPDPVTENCRMLLSRAANPIRKQARS